MEFWAALAPEQTGGLAFSCSFSGCLDWKASMSSLTSAAAAGFLNDLWNIIHTYI